MIDERGLIPTVGEYLDSLEARRPAKIVQSSAHMIRDGEVKLIKHYFLPSEYPTIEILQITDTQIGHYAFKEDRFLEYRKWILSRPNRFIVLTGDIVDAATPLSVQSPYENKWEPSVQIQHAVDLLVPMSHRILGSVGGNHERRTGKTFGDAGALIAQLLKIQYSRGKQLIDIHYGDHDPFKISIWHGFGTARTKGARLNVVHRFMQEGDSQLYLVGHLHDVVATYDWRQYREGGHVKLQKIAGVMSSSFLDYWNTFAEIAGLAASDTMMARVILEPDGHWEITLK